jgi:hypothetical protein
MSQVKAICPTCSKFHTSDDYNDECMKCIDWKHRKFMNTQKQNLSCRPECRCQQKNKGN